MPEPYAANALPVGTMVQEYRILKLLGAGSFGIVYQAENVYLDEVVAIKEFLPSDLACRTEGTRVVPLSSTTEEPYLWALRQFLNDCLRRGLHCVRVIHGKGLRSGPGGPDPARAAGRAPPGQRRRLQP